MAALAQGLLNGRTFRLGLILPPWMELRVTVAIGSRRKSRYSSLLFRNVAVSKRWASDVDCVVSVTFKVMPFDILAEYERRCSPTECNVMENGRRVMLGMTMS